MRLWTEAELLPWIEQEVSVGRSLGRPEREIRINIVSRSGEGGAPSLPRAVFQEGVLPMTPELRTLLLEGPGPNNPPSKLNVVKYGGSAVILCAMAST